MTIAIGGTEPVGVTVAIGSASFCLTEIQFPGVDGGEPIDVTTLCNTAWITKQAPKLKEVPNWTASLLYIASEYDNIIALINVNSVCVITVPTVATITFYGYIKSFIPQQTGKGAVASANAEFVVSCVKTTDSAETGPVVAEI